MTPLCQLAFKYGSDKCPQIKHHYTQVYFDLFKDQINDVKKVVEIGIGQSDVMDNYPGYVAGASLFMWRDFFPQAQIFGADIRTDLMFTEHRIRTILCDQRSPDDLATLLAEVGPDVDLFIDDGSHLAQDQIATCLFLMPKLQTGTLYAIEDVNTAQVVDHLSQYDCRVSRSPKQRFRDDTLILVKHKHDGH